MEEDVTIIDCFPPGNSCTMYIAPLGKANWQGGKHIYQKGKQQINVLDLDSKL